MNRTNATPHKPRPSLIIAFRERGTVLIVVLWIVMGLAGVALYFGHSMTLEYRASDNYVCSMEATQAIEGACRYVQTVLSNLEEVGEMPTAESYESDAVKIGNSTFWLIGRTDGEPQEGTPYFGLVDENSKLNLNTVTQAMLEVLPTMTPEFAAAIIDWRDPDEEVTQGGAEAETYSLKNPSYGCKNSPFETIEELRLIEGADMTILYGEDTNLNGILDPNEDDGADTPPDDNRDGVLQPGILEYVTVFSSESNVGADGQQKININGDDRNALEQLLNDTFGAERGGQIRRAAGGPGTRFGSVLEYAVRSGMTSDEFARIADRLSTSDEASQPGLVNIRTASEAVLACIPGIGTENAEKIISYRTGKTEGLETIFWITEVLDQESALQAGPYITAKSSRYVADVAAVGRDGRGFRRDMFVFDKSGATVTVLYRRNLNGLGWPLGADIRKQTASGSEKGRTSS